MKHTTLYCLLLLSLTSHLHAMLVSKSGSEKRVTIREDVLIRLGNRHTRMQQQYTLLKKVDPTNHYKIADLQTQLNTIYEYKQEIERLRDVAASCAATSDTSTRDYQSHLIRVELTALDYLDSLHMESLPLTDKPSSASSSIVPAVPETISPHIPKNRSCLPAFSFATLLSYVGPQGGFNNITFPVQ